MAPHANTNIFWHIYKLFNDPPGSPKELKCVGCKIAAGGALLPLSLGLFFGAKKIAVKNVYYATATGFVGLATLGVSLVMFKVAQEHKVYNELLMRETRERVKKERLTYASQSHQNL